MIKKAWIFIISNIISFILWICLYFFIYNISPPKIDFQIRETTGETNNSFLIDIKNNKKRPSWLIKEFDIDYLQIPWKIVNYIVSPTWACKIGYIPIFWFWSEYTWNTWGTLKESVSIKCDTIKKWDNFSIEFNYIPIERFYKEDCINNNISTIQNCEDNIAPTSTWFDCDFIWSYDIISIDTTIKCNKDLLIDFDLPSFKNRQKKFNEFWDRN